MSTVKIRPYLLQGSINLLGYPKLSVQNMYAPLDGGTPTAYGIALSVGDNFSRIFENPYETPKIEGVELDFDLLRERRSARLETARTDVTEARPGDEITIEALLRPYRGESILRHIPVKIPTSTPRGRLRMTFFAEPGVCEICASSKCLRSDDESV